ncbi:hypothetical protein [Candidatus Phytoplasma mali]|uniref:hypothetical protein n=1 Tax=Apple proliferation phytoplasma TaxID=37692 RepID=UPI00059E68E5|nr:hypothetical protein [Candidatus Phytoplasma mali]
MKNILNKNFHFLINFFIILILFFVNYVQNIKIYGAIEEEELTTNIHLSTNVNLEKEETKLKKQKINQNNNKMYTFFEIISNTNKNKTIPSVNFLSMSELPESSDSLKANNSSCNETHTSSLNNTNPEIIVTTLNNNFKYKKFLKYLLLGTINIFFCSSIVFITNYFV